VKRIISIIMIAVLLVIPGCTEISGLLDTSTMTTPGPDIIRRAEIGTDLQMDQVRVAIAANDESAVLLRLNNGDSVDGYFYLEKGEDIEVHIEAESRIYEFSSLAPGETAGITSDRFFFIAKQGQAAVYTFTFSNPTDTEEIVFLEILYPRHGSLFFPVTE